MRLFEQEFSELPPAVALALQTQLQDEVRSIVRQYRQCVADSATQLLTPEVHFARLYTIFDLAHQIKHQMRTFKSSDG